MATNSSGGFFSDMKKFLPLLKNLVSKDLKVKYRRSILGIAWSVLNPLFTMLVLTQVFGLLLKIKVPNFATYYIVGYSLWAFFSEATVNSMFSVLGSASLIKKVYIPKYIFPMEKAIFSLVNFGFSLIAVLLVMIIQGVFPTWTTLLFPIPVLYTFLFVMGMCLFLGAANVYFRDIEHLYSVLLTVWLYLTPIIYPVAIFDGEGKMAAIAKRVVFLNPMTRYVEYFRDVVMYNTVPSIRENLICLSMSLIVLAFGAFVFNKAQDKFILHI